jgi:hypothetical protein
MPYSNRRQMVLEWFVSDTPCVAAHVLFRRYSARLVGQPILHRRRHTHACCSGPFPLVLAALLVGLMLP